MKKLLTILFIVLLLASSKLSVSQCTYTINCYDSYGDGWLNWPFEYAYMNVYINGVNVGSVYASGFGTSYNLNVNDGDTIVFGYITNGGYDSEHSFDVTDPWGNVVASGGSPMPSSNTYVAFFVVHCTQPSSTPAYGQDCGWTTTVCSDSTVSGNSSGTGNVYELNLTNEGCLFDEHQSSWYFFQAQTAGTIELSITPSNGTDDYDFAIWNSTACPPTGPPIRCSWAGSSGATGLVTGAGDTSEGVTGDGWVESINVNAGDQFLMLVDNWSSSSQPYTLDWTLTNGASLDCTVLPVELLNFFAEKQDNSIVLRWTTATEINNDYFDIEKSENGIEFTKIGTVKGKGNTNTVTKYSFNDNSITSNINYYRLKQYDFNGEYTFSDIISIKTKTEPNISIYPNPVEDIINIEIKSNEDNVVTISINDLSGKEVFSTKNTTTKDGNIIPLNIGFLEKGIYLITINDNNTVYKQAIIK